MERITNIKFENYKAFSGYSITLQNTNILIGPNNSGKSTIIGVFRLLDLGLRKARSKKPEMVPKPGNKTGFGFRLDESSVSISLENVATNYNDNPTIVTFKTSSGNKLILYFPSKDECIFTWENNEIKISNPSQFKKNFQINIQVVPVLGPIEHEETILTEDTIRSGINSHRSSKHFRNYWHKYQDGWDDFREMIEKTWPGMSIKKPEIIDNHLIMWCSENNILREIFWAGFGFQIWCQLLTHLSRANKSSIVIIDEPEIYLHPDVQRQLMGILKDIGCDTIIATHSVELISDVDPSEILLVDKKKNNAIRLKDVNGVQKAIDYIGSTHNITLAQLARTRRMLFTESQYDYNIILKLAKRIGLIALASGNELTFFQSEGFTSWDSLKSFSLVVSKTIDERLAIATIYDRDYHCNEEINEIKVKLEEVGIIALFHQRKEIENYLIIPEILSKAYENVNNAINNTVIVEIIEKITDELKIEIQGQYVAKKIDYHKKSKKDVSTLTNEVLVWFEDNWKDINQRIRIIPGKIVLQKVRAQIQEKFSCTITDNKIIDSFNRKNIPNDLEELLMKLDEYRKIPL